MRSEQPTREDNAHETTIDEPPPPEAIAGGRNLKAIVEAAAKRWERVFRRGPDDWDLTIEYSWGDTLPVGAAYAVEELEEQGGDPVRITRARIVFNNNFSNERHDFVAWFADPTPGNNSDYEHYQSLLAEVFDEGGNPIGELNVGRVLAASQ